MINIKEWTKRHNRFGGSEKKRTYCDAEDIYMVKFPDPVRE